MILRTDSGGYSPRFQRRAVVMNAADFCDHFGGHAFQRLDPVSRSERAHG